MANWCNVRLTVAGRRGDVLNFSRLSRARPSTLFGSDMLRGEAADLQSERIATLQPSLAKKVYLFQVRNDDGCEHFCGVSRRFKELCFVLVYFDPNNEPTCGSYFIRRGESRSYELPAKLLDQVFARHNLTDEHFSGDWSADDESNYWEASWEMMSLAEAHWQRTLSRAILR